jgi:hypothetical protein
VASVVHLFAIRARRDGYGRSQAVWPEIWRLEPIGIVSVAALAATGARPAARHDRTVVLAIGDGVIPRTGLAEVLLQPAWAADPALKDSPRAVGSGPTV